MKARVKATGEIVEVRYSHHSLDCPSLHYYKTQDGSTYKDDSLDFNDTSDYWTRLEHQAAIAAMQGMCANYTEFTKDNDGTLSNTEMIVENARLIAHTLVEKMKEERK